MMGLANYSVTDALCIARYIHYQIQDLVDIKCITDVSDSHTLEKTKEQTISACFFYLFNM